MSPEFRLSYGYNFVTSSLFMGSFLRICFGVATFGVIVTLISYLESLAYPSRVRPTERG